MYERQAMGPFVGIDPGRERAPGERTNCKFRKLLTDVGIGRQMLAVVTTHRAKHGHDVRTGTIVDAKIIHSAVVTAEHCGLLDDAGAAAGP